ncbi:uncharacterized protein METZ01_LOCUS19265 [marine metagenome]|uniref:peptidylprolyl isomerase n=1 Tax=marine metagenome TaxID=408172 RepID=A0A381PHC2_9ZZZZ|nr:peptidylprolyl isomerase [Pseudomonadota bacterium]
MRSLILIGTTAMIAFSTTEANADQPQVILTTSVGTMIATLDEERAPHTVANFLELVEAEFYDGLIFHRVIAGFVIQTGGYDVHMERREGPRNIPNESFNGLMNRKGTLSMARLADPDSANSQFFINLDANTHLDALPGKPGYAVFGHLVTGTDVAEIIEFAETGIRQGMAGVPLEPILILTARRRREESRPGTSTSQRLLRDL